jgi:hypothetical protein
MRYVFEHQIILGVNTFFCKLSNYNRELSLHFHPPELSGYNPMIKYFGANICERVEYIAKLMNSGTAKTRIGLYISMDNFYYGDQKYAEKISCLVEKLVYSQLDFEYIYEIDSAKKYQAIIIPENSLIPDKKFKSKVFYHHSGKTDELISDLKKLMRLNISIESGNAKISVRHRELEDHTECVMLLNESTQNESLSIRLNNDFLTQELDNNNLTPHPIQATDRCLNIELKPSESKILIFDAAKKSALASGAKKNKEIILNRWILRTPDGKEHHLKNKLVDWQSLGFAGFTGKMHYKCEFELDCDNSNLSLSLGKICYASQVYVDKAKVGNCIFMPFEIKLPPLAKGKHSLELDLFNTMANSIFGNSAKLEKMKNSGAFNGTYSMFYETRDREKLISGLLGPVKIILEAQLN